MVGTICKYSFAAHQSKPRVNRLWLIPVPLETLPRAEIVLQLFTLPNPVSFRLASKCGISFRVNGTTFPLIKHLA